MARFIDVDQSGTLSTNDTNITKYGWDVRNRLAGVRHYADYALLSGNSPDMAADYLYDVENRRIASLYDADGDGTIDREERYVWDGRTVVLDFVDPDGATGGENSAPLGLARRYLWGPAVDQLLAQEDVLADGATAVRWPLGDHLNTTRDLVDSSGRIVAHYTYDTFGNATATLGSLSDTRYLFTGQEYDVSTAMYYYDARWYDPRVGRFVSLDPIGFYGRDANPYRYCGNNSVMFVDPSGLDRWLCIGPPGHVWLVVEVWKNGKVIAYERLDYSWVGFELRMRVLDGAFLPLDQGPGKISGEFVHAHWKSNADQDMALFEMWEDMALLREKYGWDSDNLLSYPEVNCATVSWWYSDYGGKFGPAKRAYDAWGDFYRYMRTMTTFP